MDKFDIDEIRHEWSELSRRVEREKIVTPEMLRCAIRSDAGKLRRYGWFNLIGGAAVCVFVLWQTWESKRTSDLFIPLAVFVAAGLAATVYQVRVYCRADDARFSLLERERMLIRYARFSRVATRCFYLYISAVFLLKIAVEVVRDFDRAGALAMMTVFVVLFLCCGWMFGMWLERWEQRKIAGLKDAMRELDEFLRDGDEVH